MALSLADYKRQIMHFSEGDLTENPWVKGKPVPRLIQVVPYDLKWPEIYRQQQKYICDALRDKALKIAHVGSTAVPGLAAKPVIDIDLIVATPEDEKSYVPTLEELGFEPTVREPSWYQHRMLKLQDPQVNLHVFAPDCPEHLRHLLFRNWLIEHPDDSEKYANAKLAAVVDANYVKEYNDNKNVVVRDIYSRLFEQLDMLLPDLLLHEN